MILTGSMNRPGGYWFHPGFAYQLESFELPVLAARGFVRPRPGEPTGDPRVPRRMALRRARRRDPRRATSARCSTSAGSLLTVLPRSERPRAGARELEVFATIEIIANATTDLSTHVLPTKDQLERADVTLWDFLGPGSSAQHTPAVVDPVGDRRSTWWVLAELGRRLGYDLADPPATTPPTTPGSPRSSAGAAARTTTGRHGWAEVDARAPGAVGGRPRRTARRLAPRAAAARRPTGRAGATPPLVLVPRRQVRNLNSQFDYLGEPAEVVLHPDDAAAAGVVDGEPVVVRSGPRRGDRRGQGRPDDPPRRGVGAPRPPRANVNLLTDKDDIDTVTGMVRYAGVAVTVSTA